MKTILATALAVMMSMSVVPLGGADASEELEQAEELLKLADGSVQVNVPMGGFQVQVDASGDIRTSALPLLPALPRHVGTPGAACVLNNAAGAWGFGYLNSPPGIDAATCAWTGNYHTEAPASVEMACNAGTGGFCSMWAANLGIDPRWGWLTITGYISIYCNENGAGINDVVTPTCTVYTYGVAMEDWDNWYAYVYAYGPQGSQVAGVAAH